MALPRDFFERPTVTVARELLGCRLVRQLEGHTLVARVVETEAYCGVLDLACHASKGITPRTEVLYGPAGHAYVYLVYGLHELLNVVTREPGEGEAVLFRALEPLEGFEHGARTDGPARLTRTLSVDRSLNRHDLTQGRELWLEPPAGRRSRIEAGTRVGVDYAGEWAKKPWRFWLSENPYVSVLPRGRSRRVVEPRAPARPRRVRTSGS